MKNFRTAVFIPIVAVVMAGISTVAFSTHVAAINENSTSSVTMNPITLVEHTSYVSDEYFGVINLSVDDKSIVAATADTQGHVVMTAISSGTTKVRYWYKSVASVDWTSATVQVTVSGKATSTAASVSTGLVFTQNSISIANGSTYTVTGITLNGTPVDASSLLWVASSSSVVTVEASTGKATAVGAGTSVLYAIDPVTKSAANINISVY